MGPRSFGKGTIICKCGFAAYNLERVTGFLKERLKQAAECRIPVVWLYSGPGKTAAQWERADGKVQIRQAKMQCELCAWRDKDCSRSARPVREVSPVRNTCWLPNTWRRITCSVKHRKMIKSLEGKPNCRAIGCEQLDCLGLSDHLTRGPLKEHGWLAKAEMRMFSAEVESERVLGVARCG